ncbi:MAG: glycoside hydrolase/phage tail family protein [Hoeflea sp.]|uniref:baseplate multidomain protein megatron n=1 Tax=Hoeflea sp. TaxID=1940281 RepID=UPI001DC433D4|nr:glycoside hydrolase TIM-barrel-like domain-containing protein [Hoeflea sp.]MBU4530162.1 glycoside hydrolase/phage tail family protein [Alphaproteobacteria bacterium]MBU4542553.1 glycoside hydrolase/phage tail family protein [Alphaproteobacteria bacterium]MBU4551234.1 glycoside hydrolase/phage tail family protein [Alphaproteobacteria bacterium]MBV1723057.1 glycoside hydrolase/phage tail family protein [Hoeflea sp.]MBV1760068.1 glycoside hydrolase/phage tail family protein [Hoeflea sp.]
MATILLQVAGAALGSVFGPVGTAIGSAVGATLGGMIDTSLINSTRTIAGRGLSGARIPSADEGSAILRVHGSMRIAGALIWATRFEETVTRERQGGKGGGPKVESFHYHANFALGLCEGPIASIRRVWADGRELDLESLDMRIYRGTASQLPDPLIEARQGAGRVPAWRGLAYVVFERLPLDAFGNRIPVLQFEVVRPVGQLETAIKAVAVIPGATEHGYATTPVRETLGPGAARVLNRNMRQASTDWAQSIDELQALCPNLTSVALVSSWFGDDLRASHCRFRPGVEVSARSGETRPWKVGGLSRATAHLISTKDGGPAYGGTPDDRAVIEAIGDLKARGLKVVLYPFVLMDVPDGNGLPDPNGAAEQPAYPWRGRITASPAPGLTGTPDGTAAMRTEIEAMSGGMDVADFTVVGDSVSWTGGDEGYRRFVLHHAALALAAGGVDGFIIGSEMIGLTRLRDEIGAFPFVEELIALAEDVKAMLGPATTVTYAADWTEYAGYRPQDGSGDVYFNLDALWAHPAIGAVGIDNYMPLSDWRDGDRTAGNPDGARFANDSAAMGRAIAGGEGYEWYYADEAGRNARDRLSISDGLAGKDWVYRVKDLSGWWQNQHFDRTGGSETAVASPWVPGSKPFWFTELGCPAVDKGAGQPNLFPDPKSSEGALPWFSTGARDDLAQRAFLEAHLAHWSGPANAEGMVETDHIHLWTWDARPYPAFPLSSTVWSDGPNWRTGHWLNGRLGTMALKDLIAAVLIEAGMSEFNVDRVDGVVTGHVIASPASARAVLEPLLQAFAIDVREGPGGLEFASRLKLGAAPVEIGVMAEAPEGPLFEEIRGEIGAFANEAVVLSADPLNDYAPASARSRRLEGEPVRQRDLPLSLALDPGLARVTADQWLHDHRLQRRQLRFAMPPQAAQLEPGDSVRFTLPEAPQGRYRIVRIEDGGMRRVEAVAHAGAAPGEMGETLGSRAPTDANAYFAPELMFLDLPALSGTDETGWARAGALARPWRRMVLSSSVEEEGFSARATLDAPARLGTLAADLPPGDAEGRFDAFAALEVDLGFGGLSSASRLAVLNGANAAAVRSQSGVWEIVQYETAEEIAPDRWRLTNLLRGQGGTDDAMRAGAVAGAAFVVLDGAVRSLGLSLEEAGRALNWIAEASGGPVGGFGPVAFAGGERALMPLSPVHLRAKRAPDGVMVSWIRRGRMSADSWTPADIAQDEGFERYRIEILDGEAVVRAAEVEGSPWLYPAGNELTDFGAEQASLTVRMTQAGKRVPWGVARTATIEL